MHALPSLALTAFASFLVALAVAPVAAEPTPAALQEIREKADAAFKASEKPKPPKTAEQIEAEKRSIKSHCDAVFARMAERDSKLPNNCD